MTPAVRTFDSLASWQSRHGRPPNRRLSPHRLNEMAGRLHGHEGRVIPTGGNNDTRRRSHHVMLGLDPSICRSGTPSLVLAEIDPRVEPEDDGLG